MILMVIEISDFLSRVEATQYTIFTQKFHSSVSKTLRKFNGEIHKRDNNNYWVVFESVNDAIQCALEIQHKFKYVTPKHKSFSRRLNVALMTSPNSNDSAFSSAEKLCEMTKNQVVITEAIKNLYNHKNTHAEIDKALIRTLSLDEENFLKDLSAYLEQHWQEISLSVGTLAKAMGLTYSQLYGRLIKLTGKTPNNSIKEYRLHKALELLHLKRGSISKIAHDTGFNSPTYFSQCFLQKYGVRPSKYRQQHTL